MDWKGFGRKRWSDRGICLEGLRQSTKHGSRCPGRDSNRVLSEYKSRLLLLDHPGGCI
jgi:hypothetical protein